MRSPIGDWVFNAPGEVERIEARFSGLAFSPHRHDTYAIGLTLEGVQSFDYRGVTRHSLPGQLVSCTPTSCTTAAPVTAAPSATARPMSRPPPCKVSWEGGRCRSSRAESAAIPR